MDTAHFSGFFLANSRHFSSPHSRGLFLSDFFSKKSCSNFFWGKLVYYRLYWEMYESAPPSWVPGINTAKRISERSIPRKRLENQILFLGANLVLRQVLPTTNLICLHSHFWSSALNAPIMLLCYAFASASFTSMNPSSRSVYRLISNIYTICRASLIATHCVRLPQKRISKKGTGSKLQRVSWLFWTGIVTYISCAFSARSSLLQILRNSSQARRHSVLMLFSLSSVSLLFGFCAACIGMLAYRRLQMK